MLDFKKAREKNASRHIGLLPTDYISFIVNAYFIGLQLWLNNTLPLLRVLNAKNKFHNITCIDI